MVRPCILQTWGSEELEVYLIEIILIAILLIGMKGSLIPKQEGMNGHLLNNSLPNVLKFATLALALPIHTADSKGVLTLKTTLKTVREIGYEQRGWTP